MQRLRDWLSRHLGTDADDPAGDREAAVRLAVAALLVEVLRADYDASVGERGQVLASLRGLLGLEQSACDELLRLAERRIDGAHDLYQFTSEVNRGYSAGEKVRLVEHLWRVARADSVVHKYEEHLIRRIADLLHVPHRDFIAAKLRCAGESGG